jgi:hypothetical protein
MTEEPRLRIARARRQGALLVDVASSHLPRDVASTGRHDDWNVTGPAFVARCTKLVGAILALPDEHEAAAGVLLRVLHEHVTIFAWLAIDPTTNLPQWVRHDRDERIKADNDMGVFGSRLLGSEVRSRPSWAPIPAAAPDACSATNSTVGLRPGSFAAHPKFDHVRRVVATGKATPGPHAERRPLDVVLRG